MEEILCFRLRNGVLMPAVFLGTWQLTSQVPTARAAIERALDCGYRGIDTAWIYKNEEMIGEIMQKFKCASRQAPLFKTHKLVKPTNAARFEVVDAATFEANFAEPHGQKPSDPREIFVTTKIWVLHYSPEGIAAQLEKHMADFARSSCDLVLLHWPGYHIEFGARPTSETEMKADQSDTRKICWLKLEDMYHSKKIRAIGVSNYLEKHLTELCDWISGRIAAGDTRATYPHVNQIELSVFLQPSAQLRQLCDKYQIQLTSYSTLGSAAAAKEYLVDPKLQAIADHYNTEDAAATRVDNAALMLRWAIEDGFVILPRSSNPERVQHNFETSCYKFAISAADLKTLKDMNANRRQLPDPNLIG